MPPARPRRSSLKFSWRTFAIGIVLLVGLFVIHSRYAGGFERADLVAYDLRINRLTPTAPTGVVAIAAIDDKSISELGQWPWPRSVLARLVTALKDYKASVISFDVMVTETDNGDLMRSNIAKRLAGLGIKQQSIGDALGSSNDDAFADAMKAQGTTILGYSFQSHYFKVRDEAANRGFLTKIREPGPMTYGIVRSAAGATHDLIHAEAYLPPVKVLNDAARGIGFVDVDADADGELRHMLTVVKFDGRYCVPLFLATASAFAGSQTMSLSLDASGVTNVAIGPVKIPVDDYGQMLVNYRRGKHPFPYYSISDIINHTVPPEKLAGKIVLVGATAHALGDRAVTPIGADLPRVEIHAHAIDNVLAGDFIRNPFESREITLYATLVIGLAMALAVAWLSATGSAAAGVIIIGGYYIYAQYQLYNHGLVIGIAFPLVTAIAIYMVLAGYRYVTEGLEKRYLRVAFEHYLHPHVVAALVENPGALKLSGERRHLTILFADIVNYTGLTERTDPAALVALLNDYMTKMTDRILESGGVVDKIRGDGIMAFWGAPLDFPNHARAAVETGLAMLAELDAMRARDPRFVDLEIGVGIATGDGIVGNFGGERRFDYSVIGDTVNLASRLEGLTRQFKVRLLVSLHTYNEAGKDFIVRELGQVKVKGKEQYVPIVEIAGRENDSVDPVFYRRFADALKMIREGSAPSALRELEELSAERPNDTPVHIFLDRLNENREHPPVDMIFEFDSK